MTGFSRRGRIALAALVGAACLASGGPVWADCKMKALPIEVTMVGLKPTVAAKIDGQDVKLVVDSGAFFNSLTASFALERNLKPAKGEYTGSRIPEAQATVITGVAGKVKVSPIVQADTFEFAGLNFKAVPFLTTVSLGSASGILGQNFLRLMDVEYDLTNRVMRLVQVEDCDKADLAYWVKPGAGYSIIPINQMTPERAHIVGSVFINGTKMRAIFDTGASTTFITKRAAAKAGVKVDDAGVVESGATQGIDARRIQTWVGRFPSIKIGDEEIRNGRLTIGDSSADFFDVLVGADFFLSHRVYVAKSQQKLYFSYNGGPVFNVPRPQAPVTSAPDQAAQP